MGDLDHIYLQGLALLHSADPGSTAKLIALCEETIAGSEWAGVTISGDLSSLVSKLPKEERVAENKQKRLRDVDSDEGNVIPSKAHKGVIMSSPLFTNSLSTSKSSRLNLLRKDVKKTKK